ncbi:hypothetical protein GW17_00038234 [Ensete ventricosum]|nr:hypothetical protein GW17_00038234 [Ensete ventricosum]
MPSQARTARTSPLSASPAGTNRILLHHTVTSAAGCSPTATNQDRFAARSSCP